MEAEQIFVPEHKFLSAIPQSIRAKICLCKEPTYSQHAPYSWVPYCGTCNKPMRWLVRRCMGQDGCGKVFIKDFIHDGMCVRPQCQLCWDCFQKTGRECNDDERGKHTNGRGPNWDPIIIPPAGINPREFSKEELDGFDLFAGF